MKKSNLTQEGEIPISTSSDEALKLFLEGRDKFELLEYVASAQFFEQAIEKDSNFALAYLYRFRSGVGGAKVAQEFLAKAVSLADKVSLGERYLISYYKAQVDGEGAKQKETLDKLLELFPSDKRVQDLAGAYFQFRARDFSTALKYYKRVTELDPTYGPVYNQIGYCNLTLGNFAEAEKAFKEQIKLVPERPNPYDSYAELLARMGRYDESIEQYKKAVEKDPSFAGALAGVGNNYLFKADYETAREYYEKAFDKTPGFGGFGGKFDILDRIASSFIEEGNINEALNIYKRYRDLAKENNRTGRVITSYQSEGFILTESGNPAEGLQRYQMATKVVNQPDTPEAVKNNRTLESMFLECYALLANNDTEAALAKMDECSRMAEKRKVPNDSRWLNALNGIVQSKKGNYTQALDHYSQSWPDLPFIKFYMAETYEKMDNHEKVTELYKELKNWYQVDLAIALIRHRMRKVAEK